MKNTILQIPDRLSHVLISARPAALIQGDDTINICPGLGPSSCNDPQGWMRPYLES
jgi:hypothetical protein